jgi:N-acetylmuramoyl-L-alanine amidase
MSDEVQIFKVGIDNGHGQETIGKRSPVTLGAPVVHEWVSNRQFAHAVMAELVLRGVEAELLVPEDKDIPLIERVARAKAAGCQMIVSIHSNAGKGTGIESFILEGDAEGKKLAILLNKHVSQQTNLSTRTRGVATQVMYKGTAVDPLLCKLSVQQGISAVITKIGFYDNVHDLKVLRDPVLRKKAVTGIVKAICEYTKVKYKP